jgi:hypothetical protein
MSEPWRTGKAITVWEFHNAPREFQDLSPHGGDEDWVGYIPTDAVHWTPMWMQSGSAFGCCSVSEHDVEGGTVYIGAHS